jgi:Zn-dependent peptidase ImmA (M78 family)/transcriptional regulator with XRE-family HTH domain
MRARVDERRHGLGAWTATAGRCTGSPGWRRAVQTGCPHERAVCARRVNVPRDASNACACSPGVLGQPRIKLRIKVGIICGIILRMCYHIPVDMLWDDRTANADLLVAAREALGLTQAELAARLTTLAGPDHPVSQGYVSRVEKGALSVAGDRLALFAEALESSSALLASEAKLWSLGDGCLYHRNRASTKASTLRRLHAKVNLLRLQLHLLADVAGEPLPEFTWEPVTVGGLLGPDDAARSVRAAFGIGAGPVRSVTAIAEQMGALVVALPLGGSEVDATSLHPPGEPPLFVINSDVSPERQRFTMGHEVGHVACAPDGGIDPEEMAQRFAAELLAPAAQVLADLKAAPVTPARLLQLKGTWLISATALLRRAYDLAVIPESAYRRIRPRRWAGGKASPTRFPSSSPPWSRA